MRRSTAALFGAFLAVLFGAAGALSQSVSVSAPTQQGPAVDFNFANSAYYQTGQNCSTIANCITTSRASSGTNLLPTSGSGFAYATFGNNVARITAGSGLLVEETRTNQLLNSAVPATQTTGALAATSQTLWVNGSGSAILSNGSATGCIGTATNGSPVTFTPTAGTCTVTVSGSLNAFQLEAGSFGTSLIVTAGVTATRSADVVTLTNVPVFGNAYTLFAQGTPNAPETYGTNQFIANIGNISDRIAILRAAATGAATPKIVAGGTDIAGAAFGAWAQNTSGKLANTYAASDQAASFNGAAVTTNGSALVPAAFASATIGSNSASGAFWNGYISRIALWPTTRLPNAQLQNITGANWQ